MTAHHRYGQTYTEWDTTPMLEQRDLDRHRRNLRALLAAAGADDPEAFAQVVGLLDEARAGLRDAATQLRTPTEQAPGYSWADLARPLGITRQTAHERFGPRRQTLDLAASKLADSIIGTPLPLDVDGGQA